MNNFSLKHFCNRLSFKLSLSFLTTSVFLIFLVLLVSYFGVIRELKILEDKDNTERVSRFFKFLETQQLLLLTNLEDFAYWDDSYEYIEVENQEWFEDNFSEYLPDHNNIAFSYLINKNKEIKYSYGKIDISPLIAYYDGPGNKPRTGIFSYGEKLYLVGLAPILRSDITGEPKGLMIFGREIDDALLNQAYEQFGKKSIIRFQGKLIGKADELNSDHLQRFLAEQPSQSQIGVFYPDKTVAVGTIEVKDIFQNRVADVFVLSSRQHINLASTAILKYNYFTFALAVVLLVIILRKTITTTISPLLLLEKQLKSMGSKHKIEPVSIAGPSEIMSLCATFNEMARSLEEHKERNLSLHNLAISDELTGLYNHRYFYEWTKDNLAKFSSAAILFIDLDNFKQLNDFYGHTTGDLVLKKIGQLILEFISDKGVAFRYGGEEVAVILFNVSKEKALELGQELRLSLIKNETLQAISPNLPVTASAGISLYPDDGPEVRTLLEKADKAMYYAKLRGKNACILYDQSIENMVSQNAAERAQEELLLSSVYALAAAVDAKDNYTGKHSEVVAEYSLLIADQLGFRGHKRYLLRIAALLHDIGKIGVPDDIINKNGALTEEERFIINNHTVIGTNILSHLKPFADVAAWVAHHHERFNGNGYPYGKSGQDIPIYSRIIAVADAFHAMISDRPYRKGLAFNTALSELVKNKGTQFDPEVVDAFIAALQDGLNAPKNLASNM